MKRILCGLMIALLVAGCGAEKVENKEMTITIASGQRTGIYTGEVKNGKPEGNGVFKTKTSQGRAYTYTGGFKNGTFDGNAVLQYEDGYKLEVPYKNGHSNGKCKLTKNGVLQFEGNMIDGKRNGIGKTYDKDGKLVYEGEFKDNMPNGQGTIYKKDGSVSYKGLVIDGFASKPPVKINETVSFADWQYSVTNTKTFTTIGNTPPSGIFYAVFLTAKNNGTLPRNLGNNFFVLTDNRGRIFASSTTAMYDLSSASNFESKWIFTEINPGITVQNIPIIFDIPKDAKGLKLIPKEGIGKASPILLQEK